MKWQILLIIGPLLIATGCAPRAPQRDFSLETVLLDESVFLPGSKAGAITPIRDREGARVAIGRDIWGKKGFAGHDVYCYSSARRAAREFEYRKSVWFLPTEYSEPWVVTSGVSYQSPIADQFYLACSIEHAVPICQVLAQYEECVVRLKVDMFPEFMTLDRLEQVLQTTDERMARYLGK